MYKRITADASAPLIITLALTAVLLYSLWGASVLHARHQSIEASVAAGL